MNILESIFARKKAVVNGYTYKLVLDIGTEYLKACIIESSKKESHVLGYGRVKQDYGNMDGGAITNIGGVIKRAAEAIKQAENFTPYRPTEVISGIAGEFVKGIVISVENSRNNPRKKINFREIEDLVKKGHNMALEKARERAELETGLADIKLDLLHHSIIEIMVDGYRVNNPYQFQGANLSLTIFYTFAPLVQTGAINTIAQQLGYRLSAVVAEPFAIASSLIDKQSFEFGTIIIDIGGGTTDIALIRNGGIEGTRMFAMGGRAFTRSLASNLRINLDKAEDLKLAYSQNDKVENYTQINRIIKSDLGILYQGIELSLKDLAGGESLPADVYFCGGGSGLRGLVEGFKELGLNERLPFTNTPEIKLLRGKDIIKIDDVTGLLTDVEHATPRALSYYSNITVNEKGLMNIESQRI